MRSRSSGLSILGLRIGTSASSCAIVVSVAAVVTTTAPEDRRVKVCAVLINMDRSFERLRAFHSSWSGMAEQRSLSSNGSFTRVPAADGRALQETPYFTEYPCLPAHSHIGYKALTLSNVNAFKTVLADPECTHSIVFEDDARLPNRTLRHAKYLFKYSQWPDVLYLDSRNAPSSSTRGYRNVRPGCCTSAVGYSRHAMERLSVLFDWQRSPMMQAYRHLKKPVVDHPDCLFDWMLANFAALDGLQVASRPLVKSGSFKSSISHR